MFHVSAGMDYPHVQRQQSDPTFLAHAPHGFRCRGCEEFLDCGIIVKRHCVVKVVKVVKRHCVRVRFSYFARSAFWYLTRSMARAIVAGDVPDALAASVLSRCSPSRLVET